MKKLFTLLLALAMVFALCACGASAPAPAPAEEAAPARTSFIMGIDPEYPPFSYLGDDGKYTGFDVEVCQAVCDYLGWELARLHGVRLRVVGHDDPRQHEGSRLCDLRALL